MDIQDLMKDVKHMQGWEFEQKLNDLVRNNYHFKNLDAGNKEIIIGLVEKYKDYMRRGIGISSLMVKREVLKLQMDKENLNLKKNDLEHIREILNSFVKK